MKLCLLLVVSATTLLGCLPLPNEHTYDGERELTVNWSIKGANDVPASCPAGFDTLRVNACQDPDSDYTCVTATVPCDSSGTVTQKLFTSGKIKIADSFVEVSPNYFVSMSITDGTGEADRTTSIPVKVDLREDASVNVDLYPEAGFAKVDWSLESGLTSQDLTSCATAGVDEVGLEYVTFDPSTSEQGPIQTVKWPCGQQIGDPDPDSYVGVGLTPALAKGEYFGTGVAYRSGAELMREDFQRDISINGNNSITSVSLSFVIADR